LGYQNSQQFKSGLVPMAVGVFAGFGASIHCHLSWILPAFGSIFGKLGMFVEALGCFSFFRFLLTIHKRVVERKKVVF
jgi:hypothetical protein